MKVSFIIVLYKTRKREVERLRKEIDDLGFKNYELYFVDNTKNNRGYGGGINKVTLQQGNISSTDLFVVMNPDISLKGLRAEDFFNVCKRFDIAGFAFEQDGKKYFGGEIDRWKMSGGLSLKRTIYQYIDTDFVSGSLMIIKKKVLEKIGLFDESYFMYYEDVDYCLRARKAGFRVGIDAKKFYEHFESSKSNSEKEKILNKSYQLFFKKNASIWQKMYSSIKQRFWTSQNDKKSFGFFFNLASLNFSAFLNKFLNFILFIFLVRYLTPANYGIYVLVFAFIEFFSPLLDFGTTSYGLTYLPQEKPKVLNQLFSLRFFLSITIFFLITPIAWFSFPGQKNLVIYILLTSVVVLANMWSGSFLIISSIKEKVYKASVTSVIFNIILISSLVFILLTRQNLSKLFLVISLEYLVYALVNWQFVQREVLGIRLRFDLAAWGPIVKKSFFFVIIGFFSGLYFKQDIFLLKYLKSDQTVGIYSAGYKFLEALVLMAGSYSMAVLPILARMAGNKEALEKRINRDIALIILLGIGVALIFYFTAPFLLSIFLRLKYAASLDVSRIIIFALPLILGATVCFNTLYVLGKVKIVIFIYLFQILLNLILNIILIPQYSFFASAYITVFCEIINLVAGYYFVRKYLFHENRS